MNKILVISKGAITFAKSIPPAPPDHITLLLIGLVYVLTPFEQVLKHLPICENMLLLTPSLCTGG